MTPAVADALRTVIFAVLQAAGMLAVAPLLKTAIKRMKDRKSVV